jgi:hypothetical protein
MQRRYIEMYNNTNWQMPDNWIDDIMNEVDRRELVGSEDRYYDVGGYDDLPYKDRYQESMDSELEIYY